DQKRHHVEPVGEVDEVGEAGGEVKDALAAGVGLGVAEAAPGQLGVVVDGRDVQSGENEQHGEGGEDGSAEQRFEALLAPAEPDHDATSNRSRVGFWGMDGWPR